MEVVLDGEVSSICASPRAPVVMKLVCTVTCSRKRMEVLELVSVTLIGEDESPCLEI